MLGQPTLGAAVDGTPVVAFCSDATVMGGAMAYFSFRKGTPTLVSASTVASTMPALRMISPTGRRRFPASSAGAI